MQEKKKILGISGSPRKAGTYTCVERALQVAEDLGAETTMLSLCNFKFDLCIGCDQCLRETSIECVRFNDDMTGWATKFLEYDGYIIGTSVYDANITAQLQGFFNRMRSNWLLLENDPDLYQRKFGGSIAVGGTRYGGQELALNAINHLYLSLGVKVVSGGSVSCFGAGVWSQDGGKKGVLADEEGMRSVDALAEALTKSVLGLHSKKPM